MRIIELRVENIKKLVAMSLTPNGKNVTVSGKNAQGKSSLLDSIVYGLQGKKACPDNVINDDAEKATIVIDMDEYIVERIFSRSGAPKLKIYAKDGSKVKSTQAFLDAICGTNGLAFDPMEFTRKKEKDQLDVLKKIIGLDTDAMDKDYQDTFDERTATNRDVKRFKAMMDSMPYYPDAPFDQVSFRSLSDEYDEAVKKNQAVTDKVSEESAKFNELENRDDNIKQAKSRIKILKMEIEKEEIHLKDLIDTRSIILEEGKKISSDLEKMERINVEKIKKRMDDIEDINTKVRTNREWMTAQANLDEYTDKADKLTEALDDIKEAKRKAIEAAKFPVPGLSFGEAGVLYKNQPFKQASQAEQIMVSVAIASSLNENLKIAIIRDGSLLDNESLDVLKGMAKDNDLQLWIERVTGGDGCSIEIEDGDV